MVNDVDDIPPDRDAEIGRLKGTLDYLKQWEEHPITRDMFQAFKDDEEDSLNAVLNGTVHDLQSLVGHFVLIGHIKGIRSARRLIENTKADINDEIKKL